MKDEIKEILDKLRETADYPKLNYSSYDKSYNETIDNVAMIKSFACKQLLDYITNLQEENERLKVDKETIKRWYNLCKSRNEKAIEYIKEDMYGEPNELYGLVDGEHLLNILGGDEEC